MAARALRIGGESFSAVMTGAAVFPLIEGIHIEIFVILGAQGLHFKQAAVTGTA